VKLISLAHGLDFAAAIAFAESMDAANHLFLDLLPEIEAIMVRGHNSLNT